MKIVAVRFTVHNSVTSIHEIVKFLYEAISTSAGDEWTPKYDSDRLAKVAWIEEIIGAELYEEKEKR